MFSERGIICANFESYWFDFYYLFDDGFATFSSSSGKTGSGKHPEDTLLFVIGLTSCKFIGSVSDAGESSLNYSWMNGDPPD